MWWRRDPLVILFWVAILLPALVAGGIIYRSYQNTIAAAYRGAEDNAAIVREHAQRVFEAQLAAINFVDARTRGMSWDEIENSVDVHRMLKALSASSPHIRNVFLIRPDGRAANSSGYFPVPTISVVERDYYKALKARPGVYLGQMIRGYASGKLAFNLSKRRSGENGAFNGIILVSSDLDYFASFWKNLSADDPQVVFLIRADGSILARYPEATNPIGRVPASSPFYRLRGKPSSAFEYDAQTDGRRRIYSIQRLGGLAAFAGVGIDRARVLAPWRDRSLWLAILALAVSASLAGVVRMAQRSRIRLEGEVARRRGAEATLIAKDEHMAALERAEGELRRSEARFRALFETNTQGVVHLNAHGVILDANPAAEEIFEVSIGDMIGRKISELGFEPIDEDGHPVATEQRPAIAAIRTGAVVKDFVLALRFRNSGRLRWLLVDAVPQYRSGENEPWSVFLQFSDITEQRRSAQAERLLTGEVDHRAKNLLALVQAIVRLSHADSPEHFAASLEGRIGALSRAHTLLSDSRWGDVALLDILGEAVAPYRRENDPDSVVLSGPSLTLKPAATQPMSLMVHELVTNAAKYGALSVPEGRLRISWSIEGDMLRMVWEEAGGPPVCEPERMGFGSRVIRLSAEGELGGSVHKEWRPEGLHATITIAVANLGETSGRNGGSRPVAGADAHDVDLTGVRVLLVEDNAVIANEMAEQLAMLGCVVVGPCGTLDEAIAHANDPLDVAVLDVDVRGQRVFPVAEMLRLRDVPVILCTGYTAAADLNVRWQDAPILYKPLKSGDLKRAIGRAVAVSDAA